MKNTFLLFALLLCGLAGYAQNLICVQSGSNASFYTDVQDAIDNASSGDYIYLPGGSYGGDITINKELHIVGAGHHPDSSEATAITSISGYVWVVDGADGGSLEGVHVQRIYVGSNAGDQDVHNYTFSRVFVEQTVTIGQTTPTPASHINFQECVVKSTFHGRAAEEVLVSNSIVVSTIVQFENSLFVNCVFARNSAGDVMTNMYENTFQNSIFLETTIGDMCNASSDNVFRNCLFSAVNNSDCSASVNISNLYYVLLTDIFENVPSATVYDPSYDFHLKPTCPGVGAGSDGTNVGIYGGSYGAKEGFVPYNPHVQVNQIDNQTNGQGNLPVHIQVAAQDR